MNWILQVQRQRLLIEKSSSMLMKQTGMMVSNLNIAQVRRKRRPHTGGFGAFWDGVIFKVNNKVVFGEVIEYVYSKC